MSYYDDDDEIDVRVRRHRDPSPVHYVESRPARPRSYYAAGATPAYLVPERTVVSTRGRSRSRERRSSPPTQAPIIINNIQGHNSSDDESYDGRGDMVLARHHSHSHHSSHSRGPPASSSGYMTREEYELEEARKEMAELKLAQSRSQVENYELSRARRELEEIKAAQGRDRYERLRERDFKDHADLERAKRELDEIKRREDRELQERRIKKEMELKRLEEQNRREEEEKRREKAEKEAVEKYKLKEAERAAKEKKDKELAEKEYQRRLQEDLINAGVDEKQIQAIIKKEKIKKEEEKKDRATYTRMARRHLSIETLRVYGIDFDYDQDPNYVIIRRWVPEEEQDILWKHTRIIREKRSKVVVKIEDKEHHHHHHKNSLEPEFEWVRKKERRRSKSPGLLMYLAGAK